MSILNGNVSGDIIRPEEPPFGKTMSPITVINEPSVTVAALGNDILICGGERISLYRITDDGDIFLSSLDIKGKARQIAVQNGFAYITARENGVYVCDMTNPENPSLIYNIDTVELATGIAVAGNILAVTNRHMGCELFDIQNPSKPERFAHFMCGEAQSVCLYGKYAIIGDWMNKRARIFDISDAESIKELSQMYVDGFADGVCTFAKDGRTYCVIATGHHSARLKNRRKYEKYTYVNAEMLEEGYGCGHGIEIYDITNPESPEWVSVLKTPPLFGGLDTWLVFTDGENIVFTDSMNGVFVISVNEITKPEIISSYKLPPLEKQRITPPSVQLQTGAITAAAVINGLLCTASEQNGIHILKPDIDLKTFVKQNSSIKTKQVQNTPNNLFYRSKGQIHAFVQYKDRIYCACGNEGIEVLDNSGKYIYSKKTKGICRDIILYGDVLICAESDGGIGVYKTDDVLSELSRCKADKSTARQIVKNGNGIAAVCGLSEILFLKETQNGNFTICAKHRIPGILYHRHLSGHPESECIAANPLSLGPVLLSEKDGIVNTATVFGTEFCPFSEGGCILGNKLITVHRGKYFVNDILLSETKEITVTDAVLDGQPFVIDNTLVLLNRYNGIVETFSIENPEYPVKSKYIRLDCHPEFCGVINGNIYIACGFGGIIRL